MKTFIQIGLQIGLLVTEKSEAYGDSLAVTGEFLRLLWPDGIPPERYDDAFLMARLFDKQMRFASSKDAFGESPLVDAAGYCIRGIQLHQHKKEVSPLCPGSVSSAVAESSSREQHVSVERSIAETTRTSASATTANAPLQPQRSSSVPCQGASVATATAPASVNAAAQQRLERNLKGQCAQCDNQLPEKPKCWIEIYESIVLIYCCKKCATTLRKATS